MKRYRNTLVCLAIAFVVAAAGAVLGNAAGTKITSAEYKRVAGAPKTAQDHLTLATYYRTIAAEHEAEAKEYEALAAQYQKGVPSLSGGQAKDLARAARHAAEHSRDFAEAITHLAETHEGLAEGPVK